MESPIPQPNTQRVESPQSLEAQLRECYGRVAYTHKTHEKCADIYHHRLKIIKVTQIILSAITTGGIIVTLLGQNLVSTGIAAVTSTALLALTAYTKENDLGQLTQKHTQAAGDLWYIREAYLSLLTDITDKDANIDKFREKRDQLQADLKIIYKAAPRTIPKAYKRAQDTLKLDEELTFSEEEIDNMLPPYLRKG